LGFELCLPQVPTTPKEIGVFDPTYIQTNKQTNNQTPGHSSRDSREMVFMKEAGGRSGEQQKREIQVLAAA
jgi:hypothetical protein